jgi:uroporphyrinogen decarboxylase
MTSRKRFLETMRYGQPDRVPCLDEGLRDEVIARWRTEGLPKGADLPTLFRMDVREQVPVNLEPLPRMTQRPTSRDGLRTLRRRLNPADPARFPKDWAARVKAWRTRRHILELRIHRGFFLSLGADTWSRFLKVMYLLSDAPDLIHEVLGLYGEFAARLADRVLNDVDVDWITFSEPIGGPDGPLLSPRQYENFVLRSYRPALDVAARHGVPALCYLTYANARVLLPAVLKSGFNLLWACEVNVKAMDYRSIRREFGPDLRLLGGIDLDTLSLGKQAIRREVMAKVPPLLADGGYIPLADGRVRDNIPFGNYVYYRQLLQKLTQR